MHVEKDTQFDVSPAYLPRNLSVRGISKDNGGKAWELAVCLLEQSVREER